MKPRHTFPLVLPVPRIAAGLVVLALLAACANKPRETPPAQHGAPPPSTVPADETAVPEVRAAPPMPPSADAADVTVEDIPLDDDGAPLTQEAAPAEPTGNVAPRSDTAAGTAGSAGGGGATPAGGRAAASGAPGGAAGSTGSGTVQPATPTVVGPQIRLGPPPDATAGDGRDSGATDGRGSRETAPATRGAGGAGATGSGLGHTPDLSGSRSSDAAPSPAPVETTRDLPEARDDDVVARQLREAAERERDPALREKL
ncbi:MAG: hypothetical protein RLW42_14680 [Gammaproteobacteria bacterium]